MKPIDDDLKREAIRLRVEQRLGLREIQAITGLSLSTLSILLRGYPLGEDEVKAKMSASTLRKNSLRKYQPERSKFAAMIEGQELSTDRKGRIAEAAVLVRRDELQNVRRGV